jgi:hypothetical protein
MFAVLNVRREPTAEAWFAAMRERSRFGMAIAAMIKMIATTISSSINENPRESLLMQSSFSDFPFRLRAILFPICCFMLPFWRAAATLSFFSS